MSNIEKLKPLYKRLRHNSYYLGIIQNLYAGTEGEVCCFLQFMFQTNQTLQFSQDVANMFYEIASDEMKHQILLGQTIVILDGLPALYNSQGKWLTGRNVDYIKDIRSMIETNIETKNKIVIDYKTAITKIDDFEIKKILENILEDEKKHISILRAFLKNLI